MKSKISRRALALPPVLPVLIVLFLQLDFVRAACNTAIDVLAKSLSASISTLNIPWKYKNTAVYNGYRYYINDGGSYADWYDITNSDCSFQSCQTYWHGSSVSVSSSDYLSSNYGDVDTSGIAYITTNYYQPASYTSKPLYLRCLFNDESAYVVSNVVTTSLVCICNQYSVRLSTTYSYTSQTVDITSANNPRWDIDHWSSDNTECCDIAASGSIAELAVYSDASCTITHPDLEIATKSTSDFYVQVSSDSNRYVAATYSFYLAYTTATDSYKIPVDIGGTALLTLTAQCGTSSSTVSGGDTWLTSGLTHTQYVQINDGTNDANQPAGTYFVLPQFTVSNTGCGITQQRPSVYYNYYSTQTNWLNDAVQIGSTGEYKFVPENIALEKEYKIYIFVWLDGDTQSGSYTDSWNSYDDNVAGTPDYFYLYVGCPSGVGGMTESSSLTTSWSSNLVKDTSDETYPHTFTNPDSTPSYCGSVSNSIYQIYISSGSYYYYYSDRQSDIYFDGSCSQPCTTMYFLPSKVKTYSYRWRVRSTDSGGNVLTSSYMYWSVATCGTSSTTIGSPSTLSSLTQTNYIDGTQHDFTIGVFTNTQSLCPITTYVVYETDGTTSHASLTLSNNADTIKVTLNSGLVNVKGTYNFKVKVTAEGGHEHWAQYGGSTTFTLYIVCGPSSTTLSVGSYSGSYTDKQLVDHSNNDAAAPTHFMLPPVTSSLAACVVTTRQTTSAASSVVSMSSLNDPSGVASDYVVIPTQIANDNEYTFYVKFTAEGGAEVYTTQLLLIVGCTSSVTITQFTGNSIKYVGDSNMAIYYYMLPIVTRSYCKVSSVSVQNIQFDGVPSTTALYMDSSCTQPCTQLNIDTTDMQRDITFQLVYSLESTLSVTYTSSTLSLQIACKTGSTSITSSIDTSSNYTYYVGSANTKFEFGKFVCSYSACCDNGLSYFLVSNPTDKNAVYNNLPAVTLDSTNVNLTTTIPVTNIGTYEFYVYARNSYNDQAFSGKITINVVTDCSLDVLQLKSSDVSTTLADTINPSVAHFWKIDMKPRIVFETYANQVSNFSVDISSRFQKVSSDGWQGCDFSGYRIDYVKKKYTTTVISQSEYSSLFSLDTTTGVFTMLEFNQTYGPYQIYISASNGVLWSDPSTQGWLLEVTFVNSTPALPNVPPYMWPSPTVVQVKTKSQIQNKNDRYAMYQFPEILDMNVNDTYDVTVTGLKRWMSFDKSKGRENIKFDQALIPESYIGNYSLGILMWDQNNSRSFYKLRVEVVGPKPSKVINYRKNFVIKEPEIESNVVAKIKSMDRFGRLVIQFFNSNDNTRTQNSTRRKLTTKSVDTLKAQPIKMDTSKIKELTDALDIHVKPAKSRELDEAYEKTSIDLEWDIVSFEHDTLIIQINFKDHLQISPDAEQDKIVIGLKPGHSDALMSTEGKQKLDSDFHDIEWKIPKQLSPKGQEKALAFSTYCFGIVLLFMLIAMFFLSIRLPGTMFQIMVLFRTLQVICHLPMLEAATPGNVSIIYENLMMLAWYDVIPSNWISKIFYGFDIGKQEEAYKDEGIVDQIMDLGYTTHNWMLNTRTLGILVAFYFSKLLFFGGYNVWYRRREHKKNNEKMVSRDFETWERDHLTWQYFIKIRNFLIMRLFWIEILALMIEAEFEMLISGYLQMKHPVYTTWGEMFSTFLAGFGLFVALVCFPAAIIYVSRQEVEVLSKLFFFMKWGPIYEGLKTESKWTLAYYLIYILRRILFVFIVFFIPQGTIQLIFLQYMNMFVIMYQVLNKPLDSKLKNQIETANEIFIGIITFHMLFFTDWIPKFESQYALGWSMIIWTFACIVFNILFIVYFAYHHFWMVRMNQRDNIKDAKTKLKLWCHKKCQLKKKGKEPEKEKLAIEAGGHNQQVMEQAMSKFITKQENFQPQEVSFAQGMEIDEAFKDNLVLGLDLSQNEVPEEIEMPQINELQAPNNLNEVQSDISQSNLELDQQLNDLNEPPNPEQHQEQDDHQEEDDEDEDQVVEVKKRKPKKFPWDMNRNLTKNQITVVQDLPVEDSKKQSLDGNDWGSIMKEFQTDTPVNEDDNNVNIVSSYIDEAIKQDQALKNLTISTGERRQSQEEKKSGLQEVWKDGWPATSKTIAEVELFPGSSPRFGQDQAETKKFQHAPKTINLMEEKRQLGGQSQLQDIFDQQNSRAQSVVKQADSPSDENSRIEPQLLTLAKAQDLNRKSKTEKETKFQQEFERRNNLSLQGIQEHLSGYDNMNFQQNDSPRKQQNFDLKSRRDAPQRYKPESNPSSANPIVSGDTTPQLNEYEQFSLLKETRPEISVVTNAKIQSVIGSKNSNFSNKKLPETKNPTTDC